MIAQRSIDVAKIQSYRDLAMELCEIYYPASKTAIAEMIGVSQKTIYNMIYGEAVGVYTRKRLSKFLKETFNFDVKNLKDEKIKLVPSVSIANNTITNSNVAGKNIIGDNKQLDFYRSYIELMTEENLRLRLEIEKLKTK